MSRFTPTDRAACAAAAGIAACALLLGSMLLAAEHARHDARRYGCDGACADARALTLGAPPMLTRASPGAARALCAAGDASACVIVEIDCGNGDALSCATEPPPPLLAACATDNECAAVARALGMMDDGGPQPAP